MSAQGPEPARDAASLVELLSNDASIASLTPEAILARLPLAESARHEALVALGDACERMAAAAPDRALAACALLSDASRLAGLNSARARILRASVPALAYKGLLAESIARADEAKSVADAASDAIEAARADVASLHARAKLGRTDEALAIGSAARDALLAANRADLAARAELNLANLHKIRGEELDALACLERAVAGLPDADRIARATVRNTLAETLLQLDRLPEAATALDEAERDLASMPLAHAVVVGNRADLRAREGRLGLALREFDRAATLIAPHAPGHHARLRIEEADALALLGAHGEAIESVREAILVAQAKGLRAEHARGLLVLARAHAAVGRTREARDAASACLELATATGDQRTARAARLVDSELLLREGDAAGAASGAEFAARDASPLDRARALVQHARAAVAGNRAMDALQLARTAREAAATLAVRVVEIDAATIEGAAARALGKRDDAIRAFSHAADLTDELRGTLAAERHRAAFTTTRLRAYEDLALELLAESTPESTERAFSVVERARSRALVDSVLGALDRADAGGHREVAGDAALSELRARLSALHASLARDASGEPGARRISSDAGATRARLDEIRAVEKEIDDHLARHATRGGIPSLLARPRATHEILASLAHGDALVSYFAAGDELLAFVAHEGSLTCVRAIASVQEVAALAEKFVFALRGGAREARESDSQRAQASLRRVNALARVLHEALLAPVFATRSDIDRAKRLAIVPHGALHAIPFAALRDGESALVERFEVQLAASATLAVAPETDSREGSMRAGSMLVVGVSDAFAPLIDAEVEAVAATVGHGRSTVVSGDDATAERVARELRGARTAHLACHGRFVDSLPAASGLRLADRWMPVREVVDLGLDADLVFLSGCETGRHAVDAGDELAGLGRAFLAAGARRLVVSLWPVRDQSAAELAVAFHRALFAGSRPSAALRESMLASMRSSPHPSCWAPFVVMGAL